MRSREDAEPRQCPLLAQSGHRAAEFQCPLARFASVRFVTGKLDPLSTRNEFLDAAQRSPVPLLIVYGTQTPARSRAEMEALASVPSICSAKLPLGKLSVHEEFPGLVAEAVEPFLSDRS